MSKQKRKVDIFLLTALKSYGAFANDCFSPQRNTKIEVNKSRIANVSAKMLANFFCWKFNLKAHEKYCVILDLHQQHKKILALTS